MAPSRHTGCASLPLHGGKAQAWLFDRMVRLSREILITYDRTIEILDKAINRAAVDRSEKVAAFKRLAAFSAPPRP